jgi:hypothetical protein
MTVIQSRLRAALASVVATLFLLPAVQAQAHKETAIQAMRLQVYGVGSYVHPQYGPVQTAAGFGVGGAVGFTLHHVHRIEPALDARYMYATNSYLTQDFMGGGLRVTYHAGHFHPFGDVMFGVGNINFKQPSLAFPNYKHDDSNILMFGGGLDYDITQGFALRGEFQQQKWQLAVGNVPFYPTSASLGLRYQFHFRNMHGME